MMFGGCLELSVKAEIGPSEAVDSEILSLTKRELIRQLCGWEVISFILAALPAALAARDPLLCFER